MREYVRREKIAGWGLSVAFFTWVIGNLVGQQNDPNTQGMQRLVVAGTPLAIALVVGMGSWLYVRPARSAWADALREQAAERGTLQPLRDGDRTLLRRVIRRERLGGVALLGLAALFVVAGVGLYGYLGGAESARGGLIGGVAQFVGGSVLILVGLLVWSGTRILRRTATALGRVDAPGAMAMRVRGPFVGRTALAEPRIGGVPVVVLDQRWTKTLAALSGTEVEVLLAPTFAEEPRRGARRTLVELPIARN